jgi:hypothetical protein
VGYEVVNFPLPPGQTMNEIYFDKIKRPGDVLVIHDPRPWAQHRGLNGRQLAYDGPIAGTPTQIRSADGSVAAEGLMADGKYQGLWFNRHANGRRSAEGLMVDGEQDGLWTYWHPDGKKAMEGRYVHGREEGCWMMWWPDGEETRLEFRNGEMVRPSANIDDAR